MYAGDDLVLAASQSGRCSASAAKAGRRRAPSTYSIISDEERALYNRSRDAMKADAAAYDDLFAPYNALLASLVGFSWGG